MHPLVLLHGSKDPLPQTVHLRAGRLNLVYEAGFLRYIKVGNTEVLRVINHYVRDQDWTTIPMKITEESVVIDKAGFGIAYKAQCLQGDVQFQWNCRIQGTEDSTITFEIEGEALHTFRRNRLGFTVLHPIETCSGKECIIIHTDNHKEILRFPEFISPGQPFLDITGMQWNPSAGIEARLDFEGEVFETEDQRNWMDASFKTYCTPLSKPFPVVVKKGDVVKQRIRFNVNVDPAIGEEERKQLTFTVDKADTSPFPKVGIPLSNLSHDEPMLRRIKDLQIDFLRIELHSTGTDNASRIRQAVEMDMPLEVVLFFEKAFHPQFIDLLLPLRDRIKQIIVLPLKQNNGPSYANCTDQELIDHTVPLLRRNFPACKIGGGTDVFFTELNRERTPPKAIDFLSFSINPQVHAADIATMTENLAAHREVVNSCHEIAEGKGVHVGPVTFKMRRNPDAITDEAEDLAPGTLPIGVDSRQLSLFGAAWTLGSFKYLAESKVSSITYYETCGWKGLMPHPEQPWPKDYGWPEHSVYPLYIILKEILQHKQSRVVKLISSDPLTFDGLAFMDADGMDTIMLANYTRYDQSVGIPENMKFVKYCALNADRVADLITDPEGLRYLSAEVRGSISLSPFSILLLK
jgi:D-apionolactonase